MYQDVNEFGKALEEAKITNSSKNGSLACTITHKTDTLKCAPLAGYFFIKVPVLVVMEN